MNRVEIAYTEDFGDTWILTNGPPVDAEMCTMAIGDNGSWFVGMSDGTVWKTKNRGDNWYLYDSLVIHRE